MQPLTKYVLLHDQPVGLTLYTFSTKRDLSAYLNRSLTQDDLPGSPGIRELLQFLGVPVDWQDTVTLKLEPASEGIWA